ncbi:Transferrin receptor-like dimerization domain [Phytophthora infestans]|uniref:Transferrin receptor-like dimerization domain n=1 Tax=Phytophthora infestans TaxID=4787 RepID=A0A833SNU1_PHYIN|nr:Transferrin receptor-like dimerization domain [Phytophthora infestans]
MMPLSTPLASPGPTRSRYEDHEALEDASEVYGTFHGRVVPDIDGRSRVSSKLWRSVGFATLLLVLAGYMLLQSHYESVSGREELKTSSTSPLATSEIHQKAPNEAQQTTTLSHKHKDDESDGLSKLERKFLDSVDTTEIRKFHGAYASVPHPAGSHQDYKTALFTAEQFESFGLKAEIVEYYPLLSLPIHRKLSILAPSEAARELNLTEATIPGDSCTSNEDALPPYLGYSASGNVTASVVYVNYARPVDFQWLRDHNVTLEGKIALVRYGGNFRGLKVMLAEQHGMAGVLIYSDPLDDGYAQGPVYPEGPWRPEGSFQRGSVQYNSIYGGDPLTPGFPSLPGEPYLSQEECKTIPHIPALPLSYGQARYILESLRGEKAPELWQGALALSNGGYFVGDDEATVLNLDVAMDNSIGPIWDVIGTIEGAEEPEQMVIIGNHRDAWVCGAVDPSSGSAVMLEIARGLGYLLKEGWRPRRTLVIASWDGEELGLLGSTEFAEDHAELLKKQAVAYVNVDNVVGSFVSSGGTPSIANFLQATAQLIPGNAFHGVDVTESLYEQWVSQTAIRRSSLAAGADDGTLAPEHLLQFLGSGTDFTAFYQHLGIISANLGYTVGSATYGTYHSTMDSIPYVESVGDPHYATHTTMAKWWGLITLRLVDSAIVPFDFSTYALVMQEDLAGYEKITAEMGRHVDYAELHDAIETFGSNAEVFQARIAAFAEKNPKKKKETRKLETERHFWNDKLVRLERYLLSDAGLPHRPWFKHMIFGPGFYEGYKGAAFPGISDCIVFEDDNAAIQAHVDDVAAVINTAAAFLTSA